MKSDKVAKNFFEKGNEQLALGKYSEALASYNNCLRFVVNKTIESAAFAARAEIFFKTGHYKQCIENNQSVEDLNNLIDKIEYLKNIEEKCKNANESVDERDEFFKLSLPKNEKIPFIANCLEVRENEMYGRFIATTQDLTPGSIVIIEEPFYKILSSTERNLRCAVCLKQNALNLISCTKCSTAMFCSKKCADSTIHKYECGTMEENFEKALLRRMFYQAIDICGSLQELEKLMNHHDPKKTIMNFDLNDADELKNFKNRMLATMTLAEREPWSSEAYAKYETVTRELKAETEHEKDFLRNYLVHCLKSMTVNFFHFFWSSEEKAPGKGFAICSLAAYFAHSCDPNCDKVDFDNKFVFVARKPIKKGEQLTICYDRYNFLTHTLAERKEYFNRVYTFDCGCVACTHNYQKLCNLPKIDKEFVEPKVNHESFSAMKTQYTNNCEYIRDHIEQYPCYEICTLMNQNNHLLHSMGNFLALA